MINLKYRQTLKPLARKLRSTMTLQEIILWDHLRRKQISNTQFLRQKPIGAYIADFYAPSVNLVVEVDGSQHAEPEMVEKDQIRDKYLQDLGLQVLRFENCHIELALDLVLAKITRYIEGFYKESR